MRAIAGLKSNIEWSASSSSSSKDDRAIAVSSSRSYSFVSGILIGSFSSFLITLILQKLQTRCTVSAEQRTPKESAPSEPTETAQILKNDRPNRLLKSGVLERIVLLMKARIAVRLVPTRRRWPWDKPRRPRFLEMRESDSTAEASTGEDELLALSDDSSLDESDRKSGTNIGNILGFDIGGTLSKLVYFDNRGEVAKEMTLSREGSVSMRTLPVDLGDLTPSSTHSVSDIPAFATPPRPKSMKRNSSMFNLCHVQHRDEALDQFYAFAESFEIIETGVKDVHSSFYSRQLGGEFSFIKFETRSMQKAMALIKASNLHINVVEMGATGGGAHKYADDWEKYLGIEMDKQDELDCLVAGMQFVLAEVVGECFTYKLDILNNGDLNIQKDRRLMLSRIRDPNNWSRKVHKDQVLLCSTYPYILVIIGTGVSILRVDGPRKYERISGSTIGGGTYWGLCRLLTDVEHFEDLMHLAAKGDHKKVDMMVGDIYGDNSDALEKLGLSADITASSFGKLVAKQDPAAGLKEEDLARALLTMITNNIGQVAYLNAQSHNMKQIYFVGNFLRNNDIAQRHLASAIDYWSGGDMEALFLQHDGYFGALGAFLLSQGIPSMAKPSKVSPTTTSPIRKDHRRKSTLPSNFTRGRSANISGQNSFKKPRSSSWDVSTN